MVSQITSLTIFNSAAYSSADQRKHQSSASLAFVRGIHRWPVNSPHKGPVTQKMCPFDDIIMWTLRYILQGYLKQNVTIFFCMPFFRYLCVCLMECVNIGEIHSSPNELEGNDLVVLSCQYSCFMHLWYFLVFPHPAQIPKWITYKDNYNDNSVGLE